MTAIPGSVRFTGFIAPSDSTDTYAVHDEVYGRGGWRTVATLAARNLITPDRRVIGMLVRVLDTGSGDEGFYTLSGGITNSHWIVETFGGLSSLWEMFFVETTTYTVPDDCNSKLYIGSSGARLQVLTLPLASNTAAGTECEFFNLMERTSNAMIIATSGSDALYTPMSVSGVAIGAVSRYSRIRFISDGTYGWFANDADGLWSLYTFVTPNWIMGSSYRFCGNIPTATEDNIVTFDEDGNIKDSGIAISEVGGGGGNLSDVIMPIVDTPTSMDRGDEWFNLSYSTSALSGFDILAYEPDDRPDPMPLTWKISFDAGEVCLRATPDPNSAVTVYSVPADEIYVTGPVAYVYAYLDGEDLLIDSRSSWDRMYDRMYALMYALTIYDDKEPETPVLDYIVLGETLNPEVPPRAIWSPSTPPYTVQLIATGYYLGGTSADVTSLVASWSSDDETHATVSPDGLVTFVVPGTGSTAIISAQINDGEFTDTIIADNGAW